MWILGYTAMLTLKCSFVSWINLEIYFGIFTNFSRTHFNLSFFIRSPLTIWEKYFQYLLHLQTFTHNTTAREERNKHTPFWFVFGAQSCKNHSSFFNTAKHNQHVYINTIDADALMEVFSFYSIDKILKHPWWMTVIYLKRGAWKAKKRGQGNKKSEREKIEYKK